MYYQIDPTVSHLQVPPENGELRNGLGATDMEAAGRTEKKGNRRGPHKNRQETTAYPVGASSRECSRRRPAYFLESVAAPCGLIRRMLGRVRCDLSRRLQRHCYTLPLVSLADLR